MFGTLVRINYIYNPNLSQYVKKIYIKIKNFSNKEGHLLSVLNINNVKVRKEAINEEASNISFYHANTYSM